MKKAILFSLLICIKTTISFSQLATFTFNSSPYLNASSANANLTIETFSLSSGTIETNITTGTYFADEPYIEEVGGWNQTTQSTAKYFFFKITAQNDITFDITNISYDAYAVGTGPSAFGIGIDNANLYEVNAPSSALLSVNKPITGNNSLTTATIKIQGWNNNSRTTSGAGAFRLDNVVISGKVNIIQDVTPPTLNKYEVQSPNIIRLYFSENLLKSTAETVENYTVDNLIGSPISASLNSTDHSIVDLNFANSFVDDKTYQLNYQNIQDESNNTIVTSSILFTFNRIKVEAVSIVSANQLDVLFTMNPNISDATNLLNYNVNNSIGNPSIANIDATNQKLVHLTFNQNFQQAGQYEITIQNIKDLNNNAIPTTSKSFFYYVLQPNDITINELMVDINPVPAVLPNQKYIELYNNSTIEISLIGWTLTIGTGTPFVFPAISMLPNDYLVLCSPQAKNDLKSFGKTAPILITDYLTVSGKNIVLKNDKNVTISTVNYSDTWYRNTTKSSGGWSLEKIDPTNACSEADNWRASENYMGGTPCRKNSVLASNPDIQKPTLPQIVYVNSKTITLQFSENVDATDAQNVNNYLLNNSLNPIKAIHHSDDNKKVDLQFAANFNLGTNAINIKNIKDKCGNVMDEANANFDYMLINPNFTQVKSKNELIIYFSEKIDKTTAEIISNYLSNNLIGTPTTAIISKDSLSVNLIFATDFIERQTNTISIKNVQDINQNTMLDGEMKFTYIVPQANEFVFNEFMFDVNPQPVSLPPLTYIEFFNRNDFDIDLTDWIFQAENQSERKLPRVKIPAKGFILLCEKDIAATLSKYGTCIGILTSSDISTVGKLLTLKDNTGKIISQVDYYNTWLNDDSKNGGWSIEKIDTENFCGTRNNWHASLDVSGGTPARQNSVLASNPDITSPQLIKTQIVSSNQIMLQFTEPISSGSITNVSNFNIQNVGNPSTIAVSDTSKAVVFLRFANQFTDKQSYKLSIANISDNCGNSMQTVNQSFTYNRIAAVTVFLLSDYQLKIKFSENIDLISAQIADNYVVNNSIGLPEFAVVQSTDNSFVHLQFTKKFIDGQINTISISNIKDLNGNVILPANFTFFYYQPKANDLVFNEIMADVNPTPALLPPYRYVELYNRTNYDIDLSGWTFLAESQSERRFLPDTLKAKSYMLLCEPSAVNVLSKFGKCAGILSSTDLTISGKQLTIKDKNGNKINEVTYSDSWYKDKNKQSGGWSLEKIDYENVCSTYNNWAATNDNSGGTPCKINSIQASFVDKTAPILFKMSILSSNHIQLQFNKNISINSITNVSNFQIDNSSANISLIEFSDTSRTTIHINLSSHFVDKQKYTFKFSNLTDDCGNEIQTTSKDFTYKALHLLKVLIDSENQLQIVFSEKLNRLTGGNYQNYFIDNNIGTPKLVTFNAKDSSIVYLQFKTQFPDGKEVKLSFSNIIDVNGDAMPFVTYSFTYNKINFNDIVINEVLFNPEPNFVDFVELYNRSTKKIDLRHLKIADRDEVTKELKDARYLSDTSYFFEPQTFIVLTTDTIKIKSRYFTLNKQVFIQLSSMPSFNDDEGTVVIINTKDSIIDEFHYNEKMHFKLLKNVEGISLERINYERTTANVSNWYSASETVGFATPGYKNSAFTENPISVQNEITIEKELFSPDGDGYFDFLNIHYKFPENGMVANVLIYDSKGRLIRRLIKSELLSTEGDFVWDGTVEDGTKARIGIYIVYIEVFDLQGNVKKYKKSCVVAGKL